MKFEYRVITYFSNGKAPVPDDRGEVRLETYLNELGHEGWEVVTPIVERRLILKREKGLRGVFTG